MDCRISGRHDGFLLRGSQLILSLVGMAVLLTALSAPAVAHVKWFAPYIVGAPPRPIGETLANVWFWSAIALVLVFFLATPAIERTAIGETALGGFGRFFDPLWRRASGTSFREHAGRIELTTLA